MNLQSWISWCKWMHRSNALSNKTELNIFKAGLFSKKYASEDEKYSIFSFSNLSSTNMLICFPQLFWENYFRSLKISRPYFHLVIHVEVWSAKKIWLLVRYAYSTAKKCRGSMCRKSVSIHESYSLHKFFSQVKNFNIVQQISKINILSRN